MTFGLPIEFKAIEAPVHEPQLPAGESAKPAGIGWSVRAGFVFIVVNDGAGTMLAVQLTGDELQAMAADLADQIDAMPPEIRGTIQ